MFKISRLSTSTKRHSALVALLFGLALSTCLSAVAAPPNRYLVSAGGLEVTDSQTGLIWRRCVEGMDWNGTTCTYGSAGIGFTWKLALQQAAAEAARTHLAWRLPNVKELSSIIERSKSWPQPAIDEKAFPSPGLPRPENSNYNDIYYGHYFWSSSPYATTVLGQSGPKPAAWVVVFDTAKPEPLSISDNSPAIVRLVRDSR